MTKGDLTPHFSKWEFRCHHCGALEGPTLELLTMLELMRLGVGKPLVIVSGYRCPEHNRAVGGKSYSQHLRGNAADVEGSYGNVASWRRAGARLIGLRGGRVIHVDMTPGKRGETFID